MDLFTSLLKRIKSLPRWAQSLIGLGIMAVFILIALLGAAGDQTTVSGTGSSAISSFWTILGVFWRLGLVLLLAYFSLYFLRRWQGNGVGRAKKQFTILESHHLSPRQAIHLVQVGEQVFFIGSTDQTISLISEITAELDETRPSSTELQSGPAQATFAETLANTNPVQESL